MKALYNYSIMFLLVILSIQCSDEITSRDYPRLKTHKVTDISESGATFSAEIIYRGNFEIIKYGFVWSEDRIPIVGPSEEVEYLDNINSEKFSSRISSKLRKGVSYNVRPFIITDDYTVYGANVTFLSMGSEAP
ncbi:MAG: hypothetical protein M0P26_07190 [Bacteroidales bacterium]|nr:hypothetical protein [Bacteroidales bacterium]